MKPRYFLTIAGTQTYGKGARGHAVTNRRISEKDADQLILVSNTGHVTKACGKDNVSGAPVIRFVASPFNTHAQELQRTWAARRKEKHNQQVAAARAAGTAPVYT